MQNYYHFLHIIEKSLKYVYNPFIVYFWGNSMKKIFLLCLISFTFIFMACDKSSSSNNKKPECSTNTDCTNSMKCNTEGKCEEPECRIDTDCSGLMTCNTDNICEEPECVTDTDCTTAMKCGAGGIANKCFTPEGDNIWQLHFGSNRDDHGNSLTVDSESSVYITGNFGNDITIGENNLTSNGEYDIFLAKYDKDGNNIWAKNLGGNMEHTMKDQNGDPLTNEDGSIRVMKSRAEANIIDADKENNIVIGGFFRMDINLGGETFKNKGIENKSMFDDMFIAKYDKEGNHLWSKQFGGERRDTLKTLNFDNEGNIYIAGHYESVENEIIDFGCGNIATKNTEDTPNGMFFVKLDKKGNCLWSKGFSYTMTEGLEAISIKTDSENNVFLSGWLNSSVDFGKGSLNMADGHAFIAKFDANGTNLWNNQYGKYDQIANATIAINSSDSVIVTGGIKTAIDIENIKTDILSSVACYLMEINKDGNTEWVKLFDGDTSSAHCQTYSITTDNTDNIFVAGKIMGSLNFNDTKLATTIEASEVADAFIVKFNNKGEYYWGKTFGGKDNISFGIGDYAQSVKSDQSGNVYLIGQYDQSEQNFGGNELFSNEMSDSSRDVFLLKLMP